MMLHMFNFQVTSGLHILKFKSCSLILVCQTLERRMLVQLQVSDDPLLRLCSQSTSRKHLTAQASELLAKMVSGIDFLFRFCKVQNNKTSSESCTHLFTTLNTAGCQLQPPLQQSLQHSPAFTLPQGIKKF